MQVTNFNVKIIAQQSAWAAFLAVVIAAAKLENPQWYNKKDEWPYNLFACRED